MPYAHLCQREPTVLVRSAFVLRTYDCAHGTRPLLEAGRPCLAIFVRSNTQLTLCRGLGNQFPFVHLYNKSDSLVRLAFASGPNFSAAPCQRVRQFFLMIEPRRSRPTAEGQTDTSPTSARGCWTTPHKTETSKTWLTAWEVHLGVTGVHGFFTINNTARAGVH